MSDRHDPEAIPPHPLVRKLIRRIEHSASGEITGPANIIANGVTREHPTIEAITRAAIIAWLRDGWIEEHILPNAASPARPPEGTA